MNFCAELLSQTARTGDKQTTSHWKHILMHTQTRALALSLSARHTRGKANQSGWFFRRSARRARRRFVAANATRRDMIVCIVTVTMQTQQTAANARHASTQTVHRFILQTCLTLCHVAMMFDRRQTIETSLRRAPAPPPTRSPVAKYVKRRIV